jgi:hypothetical protein
MGDVATLLVMNMGISTRVHLPKHDSNDVTWRDTTREVVDVVRDDVKERPKKSVGRDAP